MAKITYHRHEVDALCERLEARGQSRMLRSQPELCRDLIAAGAILRFALGQGMPISGVEGEGPSGH